MASLSGDSVIVSEDYIIADNSTFTNYIIPSSFSITQSIMIVLPRVLRGDLNCFRVWNYSPYDVILQYRYGNRINEIYNLFTIKSKALAWVEYSSSDSNFSVVGSDTLKDSMILN